MLPTATASQPAPALPRLRSDLQLHPVGVDESGEMAWMVHDPPRNAWFRIDAHTLRLLQWWAGAERLETLLERGRAAGVELSAETVIELVQFAVGHGLTVAEGDEGVKRLEQQAQRGQMRGWRWLIHHYLFIRIPLFRPDHLLEQWLPRVEWLFHPALHTTILLLGAIGMLLLFRQWESFLATFPHLFSWQGLAGYLVTLALMKVAHELGHAFTAKRLGCRVGSMGVALMVLFPVLYTDTTDAWRLSSRRDRLTITLAGVTTELGLALIATLLWSLLPDGVLRSIAFMVVTTGWISSLAINLNPFMRFDGYYALADLWGIDNLQPRAFALARWRLREALFGLGEPPPERVAVGRQRAMILYAAFTWGYRLLLFIGIALLVYHIAFKLLGVVLLIVEIGWLIARPLALEVGEWWRRRERIGWNRHTRLTLLWIALLGAALLVPWRTTVTLPAVFQASHYVELYPPEPALVVALATTHGERVRAGERLIELTSPDLQFQLADARGEITLLERELDRRGALRGPEAGVIKSRLEQERERLAGLGQRLQQLHAISPTAGEVAWIADLSPGEWVSPRQPLLAVIEPRPARWTAYVDETELHRLQIGANGRWIADHGLDPSYPLRVVTIDPVALSRLTLPELTSAHGGKVPVYPVSEHANPASAPPPLLPERGTYRVELLPTDPTTPPPAWRTPGVVHVEAPPVSLLKRLLDYAAAVLIRESGFG